MIKNRIKEYRAIFDMKQEELARLGGVRRKSGEGPLQPLPGPGLEDCPGVQGPH